MNLEQMIEHAQRQRERLDEIQQEFREAEADLYREDGEPLYSQKEMQERRQQAVTKGIASLAAIKASVEDYREAIEQARQQAQAFDPLDNTRLDFEKAQRLADFIRTDVETLPLPTIVARGQAMFAKDGYIRHGKREKAFLYARFLRKRIARLDAEAKGEEGLREAKELLEEIYLALGGDEVKRLEENAEQLERVLFDLQGQIRLTRQAIEGKTRDYASTVNRMFS